MYPRDFTSIPMENFNLIFFEKKRVKSVVYNLNIIEEEFLQLLS
jgi:hypothetical protein